MHDNILYQIQARWNDAAATWDIKALARIYTDDAIFFGLLPRLFVGRPQVEEYFGSYEGILDCVRLNLVEQHIRSLGDHIFIAQGFGDIANRRVDGSIVHSRVRSSFVIKQDDGEWRIAMHHFSRADQ
ncbi:nuclear transport factor 2 family protein [Rhizobium laguerreae]|uniref:YybH family protein n=1 Tax=Rhizobium laguerreae TaxID=1076926 RepID=UPI001C90EA9B|nr:SgcJ/EcaC family oxidoreductase [Rhizobium laguerreae]MBY3465826.1 nuclear transport factor 2 family protein [Rhizobium laguerreae]